MAGNEDGRRGGDGLVGPLVAAAAIVALLLGGAGALWVARSRAMVRVEHARVLAVERMHALAGTRGLAGRVGAPGLLPGTVVRLVRLDEEGGELEAAVGRDGAWGPLGAEAGTWDLRLRPIDAVGAELHLGTAAVEGDGSTTHDVEWPGASRVLEGRLGLDERDRLEGELRVAGADEPRASIAVEAGPGLPGAFRVPLLVPARYELAVWRASDPARRLTGTIDLTESSAVLAPVAVDAAAFDAGGPLALERK